MVDLLSALNSFRVNRDSKLDLPTPESPIKTTKKEVVSIDCVKLGTLEQVVVFFVVGHD